MAAYAESAPGDPDIIELRSLGARELDPLLLEETVEWEQELDWDFSRSAELVRKYAGMRALGGAALVDRGEVAGYGYCVIEDHKGLIGDLYIRPGWRRGDAEVRLFRMMLDNLIATPPVRRIESQLMLIGPAVAKALQRERFVRLFERILMRFEGSAPMPPARSQRHRQFRVEAWGDHHHDEASGVIALAYDGHIDSQINDQYRTFAGARRFLYNIVQYPGCGEFYRKASFVATELGTGSVAGIVLTSFVGPEVAHITQLCVAPRAQGAGLGYEMLRRAVSGLQAGGAKRISLTVTAANSTAVELYERCG
ncbi:MAG: GNAT family N-acetyltransferase, partial [Acidobacteriota bacterium]